MTNKLDVVWVERTRGILSLLCPSSRTGTCAGRLIVVGLADDGTLTRGLAPSKFVSVPTKRSCRCGTDLGAVQVLDDATCRGLREALAACVNDGLVVRVADGDMIVHLV